MSERTPASRIEPQRIKLPLRDGRLVIPPNVLTPGDQLVIDLHGRVTIQRGDMVFAVVEPASAMGPFAWPSS
jgi:hypothetical protein